MYIKNYINKIKLPFNIQKRNQSNKPIIFSGIQPTGIPHLGNYFGAIKNWVELQDISIPDQPNVKERELFYSIVDLHALTTPNKQASQQLYSKTLDITAILLACGIRVKDANIFLQSKVPEHTQLAWILSCSTSFGQLSRMTQWKVKSQQAIELNNPIGAGLGLFTYPVLQAADILLYKANYVPVGEDQRQHLELTRDIAERFNKTFPPGIFPLPKDIYTPTAKIQSLTQPENKMSKSHGHPNSKIELMENEETIQKKIRSALTDNINSITYDPIQRPGLSNLINIMAQATGKTTNEIVTSCHSDSFKIFKLKVAEAVIEHLKPIQKEFMKLRNDELFLNEVLNKGADKARELASKNLKEIYQKVGLF